MSVELPTDPPGNKFNAAREVARGVAWAVSMRWTIRFIGLFSTLVLARLLSPDDFGVAAMAMLVVHFLTRLSEFGTSMQLIRAKEIDDAHCDTAWTVTMLQGFFVTASLVALAAPASGYFNEPRVIEVMYILALASFVGAFENVGPVLFRREMQFSMDFRFNVYKKICIFVATISSAVVFRNYWALVVGHLTGIAAGVALSYLLHEYRPRWSLAHGREYLLFGLTIMPLEIANTLRGMLGTFMVAGTANSATVGSFRVAADLSRLFTTEIVTPMGRGLLPNYARLAEDPQELSTIYLKILGLVALACLPVGAGISAIADDLVLVLLGQQWGFASELMQYFAIGSAIFAFSVAMVNQILVATGHERSAAKLAWVRLIITAPLLWAGLELEGVLGLSKATIVAPLATIPLIYLEVRRVIILPLTALLGLVWRPAVGAIVMFLAIKALHAETVDSATVRLILDVVIGAAVFIATTLALWVVAGRPDSAERVMLGLAEKMAKRIRTQIVS